MLSPLVTEHIAPPTGVLYCECSDEKCTRHITLPDNVAQALEGVHGLILFAADCERAPADGLIIHGDGYKVFKVG